MAHTTKCGWALSISGIRGGVRGAAVLFRNVFYECIEGKLGICLLLAMYIGDDWMVDLMIIYIKKTVTKALDIKDIIINNMGMLA